MMNYRGAKTFEPARPSGMSADIWGEMTDHQRRAAREMLRLRPADVSVADWLAMPEEARLVAMRLAATPPESCGPAIPVAPARGACRVFQSIELTPLGKDRWEAHPAGYRGRDAVAALDVFDRMRADARRQDRADWLSPGQVAIGRHYRDMVEQREAGGMRCASLEAGRAGGGSGGEFIDAYVAVGRAIDAMRRRVGPGAALVVRRVRPSKRGGAGASIVTDRALVDAVCLGNQTLGAVLQAHGWSRNADRLGALRGALAAALDRMMGYV